MEADKFLEMPYEEVQRRAKELGYSKTAATRAYNLVRLAHQQKEFKKKHTTACNSPTMLTVDDVRKVRGCADKIAELIEAL